MIWGHFLSTNIPGREEKVPFAGSGYNPQKALGTTHNPVQPRKGYCKTAKAGLKLSAPSAHPGQRDSWRARVPHVQPPLPLLGAAS